jgi:hypothetical protein
MQLRGPTINGMNLPTPSPSRSHLRRIRARSCARARSLAPVRVEQLRLVPQCGVVVHAVHIHRHRALPRAVSASGPRTHRGMHVRPSAIQTCRRRWCRRPRPVGPQTALAVGSVAPP